MIIIMAPTKKSTINLVMILIKLMRKRKKEKIEMRGGMIELHNINKMRQLSTLDFENKLTSER